MLQKILCMLLDSHSLTNKHNRKQSINLCKMTIPWLEQQMQVIRILDYNVIALYYATLRVIMKVYRAH